MKFFVVSDENFFDTSDVASPEYDNAVNQDMSDPNLSPEERERQQEEYRKELVKVSVIWVLTYW